MAMSERDKKKRGIGAKGDTLTGTEIVDAFTAPTGGTRANPGATKKGGGGGSLEIVPVAASKTPVDPTKDYGLPKIDATKALGDVPASSQTYPSTTAPNRMQERLPQNNDKIASDFLGVNSRPAETGKLDAKNTQPIAGLDGVEYAGKYGKTDVFRGQGEHGEASFSDLANLSATRGGAPAGLPQGQTAITNNTFAGGSPVDLNKDGLPDQTSPELQAARSAANDRGDFSAVERSYMNPQQREAAKAKSDFENLQRQVRTENPQVAYASELTNMAAQQKSISDFEKMQYQRGRDQASDTRSQQKFIDSKVKATFDILGNQTDELGNKPDLTGYYDIVGSIVSQYPDLTPDQVAAKASEMARNPDQYSDNSANDEEAASLITSLGG